MVRAAYRPGRLYPLSELVEWPASGSNDSFLAESFVINWAHRDIPKFKSRCPNALRDPSHPKIWGRTRLDRLDVGVTVINFWSARPDFGRCLYTLRNGAPPAQPRRRDAVCREPPGHELALSMPGSH